MNAIQKFICSRCGGKTLATGFRGLGIMLTCKKCGKTSFEKPEDVSIDPVDHRWDGLDIDMFDQEGKPRKT